MGTNRGYEYRERIGPTGAGRSVVDYLAERYRHSTRDQWFERVRAGRVRIDGRTADPATPLRAGQRLVWRRPSWREPEAPLEFTILYRDDDLLAVAKPAGLPTLPGGGFLRKTLLGQVRDSEPTATPLHRIGRWTSGLVLFALLPAARSRLSRDWREGRVHKRYRAWAQGCPARNDFRVDAPIGPVSYPPLGRLFAARADGKPATTRVRVLERRGSTFLADVWIETGRPHQVRIHLAAAGHPLVGDPLYVEGGAPHPGATALPGDPGYRLHAAELRLVAPTTRRPLRLVCAPPPVLRTAGR